MPDTIAVALITGAFVAVPSLVATIVLNNKSKALWEYRLDKVEEKMDKHNEVIERTFIIEEKMKVANHRIEDLENK